VDVVGLGSGVAAVSAGAFHTCAVTSGGGVKCWGLNDHGQLGDGTSTDANVPVGVVGLYSGVVSVSVGSFHSCAIMTGGAVKCWGDNMSGQLGNGSTSDSNVPTDVVGLSAGVVNVGSGAEHSCAVTVRGAVKCWGWNNIGQLGDGSASHSPALPTDDKSTVPVDVLGLSSGAATVSAGYADSCVVMTSGAMKCWGFNRYGQLGNGTTDDSRTPTDVIGLGFGVGSASVGNDHVCAVTTGSVVKCWGDNPMGLLGRDSPGGTNVPWEVVGLTDIYAVSTGGAHNCVVTTEGAMKCWGSDYFGQLGNGVSASGWVSNRIPVDVVGLGLGVAFPVR
jgi:alpha-tubulin suppressor-like RCC1 family protein